MQEKDKSTGKANKTQKKSWFQGLKSEFNKIVWTDKATLAKQTVVVSGSTSLFSFHCTNTTIQVYLFLRNLSSFSTYLLP